MNSQRHLARAMISQRSFQKLSRILLRGVSSKPKVELTEEVSKDLEKELYKPRLHPGVSRPRTVELPEKLIEAVENTIEDHPIKGILQDSIAMVRHLHYRNPPMEKELVLETQQKLLTGILKNAEVKAEQDQQKFQQRVKDKLTALMKVKIYNWTPMQYNLYDSLVYLVGRFAPEYAALVKIFTEIHARDEKFKPRSLFDFGSGVGTVSWASHLHWQKDIYEYYNVDTSADMNDLAMTLLKGGRGNKGADIKGVYYRQFFPHRNETYDLVVSAYSLMELPSFQSRMETILRLWNKTEKYLVLVENGTNAGFKVINEARDFILQIEEEKNKGHVFSPCPHDLACPRFLADDGTPCNFQVTYMSLPIGSASGPTRERYSYVVLKKGRRSPDDEQWPRLVREMLKRSKHSICRVCSGNGKLEEVIFTAARHGKTTYHCARSSKWGDRLPVKIKSDT